MTKKIKIGVIYGGQSSEHEVSIASARSVMEALDENKYEITPIKISKKGEWSGIKNPVGFLKNLDVVFPMIHGTFGEDGTLQGFLEFNNIPYVGAGVMDSAIGMDKVIQKDILAFHKIPVVEYLSAMTGLPRRSAPRNDGDTLRRIGYPCFVKPANGGSSVGISKVNRPENLEKALNLAKKYDSKVIIERAVSQSREFECAVLGNDNPKVSVAGEVVASNDFYDYNAKYIDGKSEIIIPAKISKSLMTKIQTLAIETYKILNCSGMARVDFLYDEKNKKLFVNEINTVPGFTAYSMYPKLWENSGLKYPKLLDKLIDLGIERHKKRQKLLFNYKPNKDWWNKK